MLRQQLVTAGFRLRGTESPRRIALMFFNVLHRRIAAKPRLVLMPRGFSCPPHLQAGLDQFKAEAETGVDLSPRQSRTFANDADFADGLLNDWDIHHFHLGLRASTGATQEVPRTAELLFARVTDESVYLVGVSQHGTWTRQDMLLVLHENWPASIERWRLKSVLGLERRLSDEDVGELRKAGVTTLVEVAPGVVYAPPGGGQATSGDSILAVMWANKHTSRVMQFERFVKASVDSLLERIREAHGRPATPPEFRLVVEDGILGVREVGSGITFLYPEYQAV